MHANISIKKPDFNYNLIRGGSIGFAESYMRGEFETDNLSDLIELTARNIEVIHKFSGLLDFPIINFVKNKIIKNTKSRSKENIAKHYDLGNDFFSLWLDDTLTYSSAIFDDNSKNLSVAQNNKYQKLINLILFSLIGFKSLLSSNFKFPNSSNNKGGADWPIKTDGMLSLS